MRALAQRVTHASVTVGDEVVGRIGPGLVILLGIAQGDDQDDTRYIVEKVANLRIFSDEEGRFNRSALDTGAEFLIVSQFTLYADTRRGRRPSFTEAAPPEQAESLFNLTVDLFRDTGLTIETGRFQAHMMLTIQNDGPVTIMLDSADRERPRRV